MLKRYDALTARQTLLKRSPIDDMEVPPSVQERITRMFGEAAHPGSGGRPHPARCAPARRYGPGRMDRTPGWPAGGRFSRFKSRNAGRAGFPSRGTARSPGTGRRPHPPLSPGPAGHILDDPVPGRHARPVCAPHPAGGHLRPRRNGAPALFGADVSRSGPGGRGERNRAGRAPSNRGTGRLPPLSWLPRR